MSKMGLLLAHWEVKVIVIEVGLGGAALAYWEVKKGGVLETGLGGKLGSMYTAHCFPGGKSHGGPLMSGKKCNVFCLGRSMGVPYGKPAPSLVLRAFYSFLCFLQVRILGEGWGQK